METGASQLRRWAWSAPGGLLVGEGLQKRGTGVSALFWAVLFNEWNYPAVDVPQGQARVGTSNAQVLCALSKSNSSLVRAGLANRQCR